MSDCLATALALASSWKSKGAARRIVKDEGSGLIKPIETHRKGTDQCKELEDSDAAKQRSPGLCRDKAEAREIDLTPAIPTLLILMLMADAKPFWSALYHSLTLTDTEDYEYRR